MQGFSVTLSEGIKASSFKPDQKLFIDPGKLLPVERFLQQNGGGRGGRGGQRGGQRGGRGGGGFQSRGGQRGK